MLRHILNLPTQKRRKRYTITGTTDGFGSQYLAIMSGIAYCESMNYEYVHTPFSIVDHGQNPNVLNTFIGIPAGDTRRGVDITELRADPVHNSEKPSIYYTENIRSRLRAYYFSTAKPAIPPTDIVIHIRRGDVGPHAPDRYTSNTDYVAIIQMLKATYPNRLITVHSEGYLDDFKELIPEGVDIRLNDPIAVSFHCMVMANVLVTAKSGFSYTAGILNKNKVYYIPFWHNPLDDWTVLTSCSAAQSAA